MAFVAEDGSGLSTATSYVSLADANEYFSDRSNSSWAAATDAAKQAALVKASQFIDIVEWKGGRMTSDQGLAWPRFGVFDRDGHYLSEAAVPRKVKAAACEFAAIALTEDLIQRRTRGVLSESVAGAISVTYDQNSPDTPRDESVWGLVSDLIDGSSLMGEISRG